MEEGNKGRFNAANNALRIHILHILNDLVRYDQKAMHQLAEFRVEPNEELQNSDSPVVLLEDEKVKGRWLLGIVGILNGVLGEHHKIAGQYDDDGDLIGFKPYLNKGA